MFKLLDKSILIRAKCVSVCKLVCVGLRNIELSRKKIVLIEVILIL